MLNETLIRLEMSSLINPPWAWLGCQPAAKVKDPSLSKPLSLPVNQNLGTTSHYPRRSSQYTIAIIITAVVVVVAVVVVDAIVETVLIIPEDHLRRQSP
jgi:hypothetical protein